MKSLKLGLLILSLAAVNGAHAVTRCSNAGSTLQHHAWRYEGGAAPPPEMVVYRATWSLNGQVIDVEERKSGGGGTAGDIEAKWDAATKKVLASTSSRFHLDETYAQKVTLTRKSGGAVDPNGTATQASDFVICHRVENFGMP